MKTNFETVRAQHDAAVAAAQPIRAPLAPLLAGARARGVADGLELVGAAAVLLDEHGDVLHVNARALTLMGQAVFLSGQRLRARGQEEDDTLSAAIESSLRRCVGVRVPLGAGPDISAVRIVPVASEGDDSFQLLRAVAIFEAPGEAAVPVSAMN